MTLEERILRIEKILVELRNPLQQIARNTEEYTDMEMYEVDKLIYEIEKEHR